MAYDFNGTTQYLSSDAPQSSYPVTISAWVYPDSVTGARSIVSIGTSASLNNYLLYQQGTDLRFRTRGASVVEASVASVLSTGAWYHAVAVGASATSRTIYYNHSTSSTQTASQTPTGMNNMTIGARVSNTSTPDLYFDGRIAEVAVWGVALSSDDVKSLYQGLQPSLIRPQDLVYHSPMIRELQDIRKALSITNNNAATVIAHPRRIG